MKRSVYLTAAMITALTACKPSTVVVGNNTATNAASTTGNIAVNEAGVNNNVTSTGVVDVNNSATNDASAADVNKQ